ncbi:MAG: hypothetical protein U9R56_01610 [candidate division Zixibacteria bacterium]|nr:hypothetical protein [candidate division Zixibacteria bacterium]
MHKRVLLAEQSDTISGVAGTVLRQNGFEVITVSTADKAMEVLNFSRPDVMVIGGSLSDPGQRPLYERIVNDTRFTAIPLLLLAEQGLKDLPFPEEVIVRLPFNPGEFVEKVAVFSGRADSQKQPEPSSPLEGTNVEDDTIDAALGLDQVEVTGSEVMDQTTGIRISGGKSPDKMMGIDHDKPNSDHSDITKVESINIPDDQTDIVQKQQARKPTQEPSSTGKLDILKDSDQYSIAGENISDDSGAGQVDDYEWFLREMQSDTLNDGKSDTEPKQNPEKPETDLSIVEPSAMVDPTTPPPKSEVTPDNQSTDINVEKFIGEFKKEVQKLQAGEPESVILEADKPPAQKAGTSTAGWDDSLEKLTTQQTALFSREFTAALAEKIAEKIVTRIDPDELMELLRSEIIAQTTRGE